MLCNLFKGDYGEALTAINILINDAKEEYKNKSYIMRGIINKLCGKNVQATKDFVIAKEKDPLSIKSLLELKEPIKIEVFPEINRFCSYIPYVKLTFPEFPCIVSFLL